MSKKTESKKTEPKIHKETIEAPYKFTDAERLEIASQLAAVTTRVNELEDRKKSVSSDFKAQIDAATATANSLSGKFTAGFEMRPTECRVDFDAKNGIKTYFNLKTGALVKTSEMNRYDYEQNLPLEIPDGKKPLPNPVIPEEEPHIKAGE